MQTFTSASTSINSSKLPAIFRRLVWAVGEVNLDMGGGKFDNATEYLRDTYGAENLVLDPYNRPKEQNKAIVARLLAKGANTCTVSNVLNVIDSEDARLQTLRAAKSLLKDGGAIYITIYEGDRSSVGRQTGKDSWQNNRPLKGYLEEVKKVFPNATTKYGMIIASK